MEMEANMKAICRMDYAQGKEHINMQRLSSHKFISECLWMIAMKAMGNLLLKIKTSTKANLHQIYSMGKENIQHLNLSTLGNLKWAGSKVKGL